MFNRKLKLKADRFYKPEQPLKIYRDWRKKKWQVVDKKDVILAEGLTKEIAETFMQAVNYSSKSLALLKMLLSCENIVEYAESVSGQCINQREELINLVYNFLLKLGVVEPPPPKWESAFKEWSDELMENFYKRMQRHTEGI